MKTYKLILSSLFVSFSIVLKAQESTIVPGNLLVMVSSDADAKQLSSELQSLYGIPTGLKIERTLSNSMHIYLYDFNSGSINRDLILKAVRRNHLVKIAQFNHKFQERIIPDDAQFAAMWDMNNTGASGGVIGADIHAPQAWDITTGGLTSLGDTIVVAAIDGGFDLTHADLNFWKNYNEIPGNGIDDDGNGYIDDVKGWNSETGTDVFASASHGTHLSGTIGARGNNGIGVTGVNWNVKVMPISYGNSSGDSALEANAIACYSYVRDQRKLYNQTSGAKGAFVVSTNSSFGIDNGQPINFPMWCAMYDSLGAVGILSAAATANHNWNIDVVGDIPTACASNWLIAVTNTTNTDQKYANAGYGATSIDIGAPGTNIVSTIPGDSYGSMTGTSMATPHV
ncbi:MAG: S8 family serine peptidase, partial [Bacteroidia bacterium]